MRNPVSHVGTQFTYTFENFFHPFIGELIGKLNRGSLPAMMDATWQDSLKTADPNTHPEKDFFHLLYNPNPHKDGLVQVQSFAKEIDVSESGPYSNYNWELFFHIPLTVAVHLSKTQRFAEAQRWFHYIFDPTSNDQTPSLTKRFWKFLAFRQGVDPTQIDYLLSLLSQAPEKLSKDDKIRRAETLNGYQEILKKPFQPHAVARTRHSAYQYYGVMKYLDNLIAWGDNLFQQDTVESINEATMIYVLAANILGQRPERIPSRGRVQPKTFAQLKTQIAKSEDPMANALVDLEGQSPFNLGMPPAQNGGQSGPLFGIGRTLYFCIPHNDKLLSYWDTVADRLFKIRHCMNIEGIVRPLALFDPPLDPGMLVKAAAAGIDIRSIVSGLTQPIGPVRCLTLIQKTLELCSELRGLGSALLSALEKGDGEHLALVRQRHEIQLQKMTQDVRFLQWRSAQEATKSLLTSRATTLERLRYYQRLLGLSADQKAPDTLTLDQRELTEANFDEQYDKLVGQYDNQLTLPKFPDLKIAGNTSPVQQSGATGPGNLYLNTNEDTELNNKVPTARDLRVGATVSDSIFQVLALLPLFSIDCKFWGVGGGTAVAGGPIFSGAGHIISSSINTQATNEDSRGASASKTAGYERRADDWLLQYNLAAHELMQNGRQILTSLIAEQIAHHEYLNIEQQIANAQEVDQFLHEKFTNEELYLWMQGEISRLYYEYYRFAFDTARKAERTMKHELMRPELDAQDFVKFNYWDGGRKGLLSGEALYLDVKRMEMAYHDNNKRELELTRHISLRQLDPLALLALKTAGVCQVTVPEWLYDRDCPGHYLRRIKSVGLSIPSVVGPYTSLNCTLSLLKSSLRKSPIGLDYKRQGTEDERFVDYTGAVQSIVTSGASNDSGLFEPNLRDERFLPFEGAGAESTWKLELPADYRPFDYATISDVILHIRYTARQGVDPAKVKDALSQIFGPDASPNGANLALLFSLPHDFPTEWSAFVSSAGASNFSATIRRDYFPYFTQGKKISISGFDFYGQDTTKHGSFGDQQVRDIANTDLEDKSKQAYTLSIPKDGILTPTPGAQIFLIIRYSISQG
jgi:hypothetical protein